MHKNIDIFEYSDYRKFLGDYYNTQRHRNSDFTYRYIAKCVGFKSAGHFTQILKGSVNLSVAMAENFAEFLRLGKKQAEYFCLLVRFNQARTHAEKERSFRRMLAFSNLKIPIIHPDQYVYFDKWYYVAVREVLAYYAFKDNYAELARKLNPAISPTEAKKAIALLLRLGLIVQNKNGFYERKMPALSADPVGKSVAITNQALDTMRLASEAIDRFPKEQRNISGVAFSVSGKTFETIQEEVRNFRKKILEIAQADACPDGVYQFNVQLFPLTRNPDKGKKGEASCA